MSFVELRISLDDGLLMYMEDEFMEVLEMGSWKFDYVQVYTYRYIQYTPVYATYTQNVQRQTAPSWRPTARRRDEHCQGWCA